MVKAMLIFTVAWFIVGIWSCCKMAKEADKQLEEYEKLDRGENE
jgi:hypothetical protein